MVEEINLNKIFGILRKRIFLISVLTLLAIAIAGGISYYVLTPVYQSSTQILVNQEQRGIDQLTNQAIQTDLQLINTYSALIKSPIILEQVIEELGLNTSYEELNDKITVISDSNSQLIDIFVKDENPAQAVNITNMTATVFQSEIKELMNVDNVKILLPAVLKDNPTPVDPNPIINMAAAAAGGLILGIGIAFLLAYLDTTIKNEEDIEDILGVPLLAVISPIVEENQIKETANIVLKEKEAFRI